MRTCIKLFIVFVGTIVVTFLGFILGMAFSCNAGMTGDGSGIGACFFNAFPFAGIAGLIGFSCGMIWLSRSIEESVLPKKKDNIDK